MRVTSTHLGMVVVIAVAAASCKKNPEPEPTAAPASSAPATPPAPTPQPSPTVVPSALPMGVTWEDPSGWQRVPRNNPMRKATYTVPRAKGDAEDAELAVFYFGPGEGGGIDANVDRWVGQFVDLPPDQVKRADRSSNGLRQHVVEVVKGTFHAGMPGMPTEQKEGYGLLAGIVEAPSGAYFFKMTGPSATVKAARPTFFTLLDSVKPAS